MQSIANHISELIAGEESCQGHAHEKMVTLNEFLISRSQIYIRLKEAVQVNHGYHTRPIIVLMRMQRTHMPIITIWHNTAVYLGYHSITVTVQGNFSLFYQEILLLMVVLYINL